MDKSKVKILGFPITFWIANVMEIFERMAWYGFYVLSSLYLTGAIEDGGLGFSEEDRGLIQGAVLFFLYIFPAFTGALADRYGYKKMLFYSYLVMAPSYYLLGTVSSLPSFLLVFMMVAVGAAMFKPVITGTIAKSVDDKTGSLGFGLFYMMINIGGFIGPFIAGILRGMSWDYVFLASAIWITINIILVLLFYDEPKMEGDDNTGKSFSQVLKEMTDVLGNIRFFIFVFVVLLLLVIGQKAVSLGYIDWFDIIIITVIWTIINFVYDIFYARKAGSSKWYLKPMQVSDWKFGLFLLLMSGFWTSFNQLFMTLPNYIRDYVDTADIYFFLNSFLSENTLSEFTAVKGAINPEFIVNLGAFFIIIFQIIISFIVTRMKPFSTIFYGVIILSVSFIMFAFGTTGWIIVAGILVFAIGEMMASPKSQEYTGMIAPPSKKALYMGYFFWCIALGNLFGGLLSGSLYGYFGDSSIARPDIMWLIIFGISLLTAALVFLYDKFVIKKSS